MYIFIKIMGLCFCTAVFGITAILLAPLNPSGKLVHWFARWWGRTLLWIGKVQVSLEGIENIPADIKSKSLNDAKSEITDIEWIKEEPNAFEE